MSIDENTLSETSALDSDEPAASNKRKGQIKTWLILIEALIALSFVPWLMMAGLSVMAFDSGYSFWAVLFVGLMWTYPLAAIIFSALAWVFYARKKYNLAAICPLLSFLPLAGILFMFAYDFIASALTSYLPYLARYLSRLTEAM